MNAKKCDRCKEFYEPKGIDILGYNNVGIAGLNENDDTTFYMDLCPECLNTLKNWLERRKDEE